MYLLHLSKVKREVTSFFLYMCAGHELNSMFLQPHQYNNVFFQSPAVVIWLSKPKHQSNLLMEIKKKGFSDCG